MIASSVRLALVVTIGIFAASPPGMAQPQTTIVRIGYLSQLSEADDSANREALRQGLSDLGYIEGRNTRIEARYADGRLERLPDLAAEIARSNVDVIIAAPTPAVRAVQQATHSIPTVMAFVGTR